VLVDIFPRIGVQCYPSTVAQTVARHVFYP
jgi:hypothetical protein